VKQALPLFLMLVVGACSEDATIATTCTTSAECDSGESCLDGVCVQPCNSHGECEPAEACTDGFCQGVSLPSCHGHDDCTDPGPCEHSEAARCAAGECVYEGKLPGASCDDGDACTDAETCDLHRICSGVERVCNTPPSSECIAGDTLFRTYSSPGACDSLTGECIYQSTDESCADCTVNCLSCDEHADCAPDGYCNASQECTPRRADGGDCAGIGAEACISRYCDGTLCCDRGECCNNAGDCSLAFETDPICTDTTVATNCQGTRQVRACDDHVCGSQAVDDDNGCEGILHACPNNLAPVACTAEPNQQPPVCPAGCETVTDCDNGFRCDPPTCVLPSDTGSACTGTGQGTCETGLECENGVCCAAGGPPCCADDGDCANELACNDAVAACYVACNNYDSARCADPANQYCFADACVAKYDDGVSCVASSQCTSGHCQNGSCCASGDCCFAVGDCPSSYTSPPSCDVNGPTTTCQGTRADATCVGSVCGSAQTDDDSGCTGEARACPNNLAPVLCTADPDQAAAQCPSGCTGDGDCLGGYICVAPSCVIPVVDVEPVYPSNPDWNDYVVNSQPQLGPHQQEDASCTGSEVGFDACLHAGELRKVVVTAVSSCTGVAVQETLGVFDWICEDHGGAGPVELYTTGLSEGRGLADLLSGTAFLENAVTITSGGQTVAYSEAATWWSNAVEPLPDNSSSAVATLDQPGTIYTLAASRQTGGYNIDADRVALVTLGNAVLTYSGRSSNNCAYDGEVNSTNIICVLAAGGQQHLWLEGTYDSDASGGTDATHDLVLASTMFSRVHRFTSSGATDVGVQLRVSNQNRFTEVTVSGSGDDGFVVRDTSLYNHFENLRVLDATDSGVITYSNADFNRFVDVFVSGCGSGDHAGVYLGSDDTRLYGIQSQSNERVGLRVGGARNVVVGAYLFNNPTGLRQWTAGGPTDNIYVGVTVGHALWNGWYLQNGLRSTISHVTAVNNIGRGSRLGNQDIPAQNHTFNSVLSLHNLDDGLAVYNSATSGDHRIHRLAGLHNGGFNVEVGSPRNAFTGDLWVSDASGNCNVASSPTAPGIIDGSCTDTGADGSSSYSGQASSAVLHTNTDLTNGIVGRVETDDPTNTSDDAGAADFINITDWHFDNPFRTWGPESADVFDVTAIGPCNAGSCRIYDWRLLASDTAMLNINGAFVDGAACPASVHGDEVLTDQQSPANTFLTNAIEMVLDGVGDDDGLCETDEACIYSPNVGAYQGEGPTTRTCTFQDGVVSGVTMHAHLENGVE